MRAYQKILFFLLLTIFSAGLSSCSKSVVDETVSNAPGDGNSTLNIITRADDGEAQLSYPISLYVFNSSNQCIATQTLNSSDDAIAIANLRAGTYSVYAIGGADENRYTLPSKAEATPNSLISLQEGKIHEDLMAGHNTVVIGDNETNQLTLTMSRMVSMLKSIKVNQIPDEVSAVAVTITPLREAIRLNGEPDGDAGIFSINLVEQSDGRTWKNATQQYMLPSNGQATITIKMTRGTVTNSYSYTCQEAFLANYIINIDATYTGSTFNMTGTLTGATWAGERTITFEFDENSSVGSETTQGNEQGGGNSGNENQGGGSSTDQGNNVVIGEAPTEGTVYQGCYVLSSINNNNGTSTVTLMTPTQTNGLSFNANDQNSIKTAVEEAISSIAVSGISGWRLPTKDEMDIIRETGAGKINENLNDLNLNPLSTTSACYFYTNSNGQIRSYLLSNGRDLDPDNKTFLRVFTILTFKEN